MHHSKGKIMNNLSKAENLHSDKGYQEATLEQAEEFAKKRGLTDGEIEEVFWEIANKKVDNPVIEFARAILRKAKS